MPHLVGIGIVYCLLFSGTTVAVFAQTGGGATLVGTVRDSTGAVVGGAKVVAINTATNFIAEHMTSAEGSYYIPYLVPGEYRIKVTAAGFKEIVREGILLRSAEVPRIDINLEVGAVTESVTVSGSDRYLTNSRVNPTMPVGQANTPNWDMGLRFPTAGQTPYFKLDAFAYPEAYTIGALGARVVQAPGLYWMQTFLTKSWYPVGERLKLSFRLDGHDLPHKRPNLAAPNTQYNLNNTGAWARFTGVVGDFSNFGTAQADVQMSIRAEF